MTERKRGARRRPGAPAGGSSSTKSSPSKRVSLWIYPALFVLAVFPYLQTARFGFVNFDDGTYVAENPVVQQGLTWSNFVWAFTAMSAGNWHPLTWLSHMLDCQIFGLQPGWHHLVSVLVHGLSTMVLFLALRAMTGSVWRSALCAALFAVHPLHVESVAWIAERKDVLSTFFGLLAIWAYARYAKSPSLIRYGVVVSLFALSLLSKPMLVTLPFVLLLLDLWPLKRFWIGGNRKPNDPTFARIFLEKLPLLAMSVASSVVTFKAQHAAGAVAPIDLLPLSQRLANAMIAYAGYLGKGFWPTNLAAIYPLPDHTFIAKSILAIVILAGITIGVCWSGRKRPWLIVGWLWFLGTLVPVIGLVQVGDQAMADRYTYVPLIGIFIMLAWSIPEAAAVKLNRGQAMAVMALPVIVLGALTWRQVLVWRNTRTLFENAVNVTERNFVAHNLLAGALGAQGDFKGAREQVEKSLQIRSNYSGARYNLGLMMLRQRDFAHAQEQFNLALQTNQKDPMIWNALGLTKVNLNELDEAISHYRHALELNPNYPDSYANLGAALLTQQKFAEAAEMSEKALTLNANIADAHATLAAALWNLGRVDDSILHNRRAVELNPNLVDPRLNLGIALFSKGNVNEAIADFEYVLRLDPQNEVAQKLLTSARRKRDGLAPQP